jgi:hypothetical protein
VAKKKKNKKIQPVHSRGKHSKTYLEMCYASARRIFRALGEEESTLDIFTKRQKREIFSFVVSPPHIAAHPGHRVPRQYVRYVQDELVMALKRSYFDEQAGVTWMDMITIGQSILILFATEPFLRILSPPQLEVVKRLNAVFEQKDLFTQIQMTIANRIKVSLMFLSQPNFRIYGQTMNTPAPSPNKSTSFQYIVHIVTHECQSLRFKYGDRERTAYRIAVGQLASLPYTGATILKSKIFPDTKRDRELNIYIQSHAIHRFKERIDTLDPVMRNELFVISMMITQRVVRGPDGVQYIACMMPVESRDDKIIGYFAFTIDGDNLLVLTLLPLLSRSVPEGRVLCDRLKLSQEELKYLGMDKLSFFYEVDIEQIPVLKQVLFDELHLDYIHTIYNSFRSKDEPFSEKKTLFVKNFFQKLEEHSSDDDNDNDLEKIS